MLEENIDKKNEENEEFLRQLEKNRILSIISCAISILFLMVMLFCPIYKRTYISTSEYTQGFVTLEFSTSKTEYFSLFDDIKFMGERLLEDGKLDLSSAKAQELMSIGIISFVSFILYASLLILLFFSLFKQIAALKNGHNSIKLDYKSMVKAEKEFMSGKLKVYFVLSMFALFDIINVFRYSNLHGHENQLRKMSEFSGFSLVYWIFVFLLISFLAIVQSKISEEDKKTLSDESSEQQQ